MSIVKSCSDVWFRLFDHKTFIQSELNSFIKEFEENRHDREVENLLDSLNVECEIRNQCNKIESVDYQLLQLLKDKVGVCSNKADQILNFDKALESKQLLEIRKREREEEWEAFSKNMETKYIEANSQFIKQEGKLKQFYEEQENKLKETRVPLR